MAGKLLTVFGGSGFLGRQIVTCLAARGVSIRVAVRQPERAALFERIGGQGQIERVRADVWQESTVARAVRESTWVINCVGHYVEKSGATFDAVHGQGAHNVAKQARIAGVERLIHISGVGADPQSRSPYVRARGIGEDLVRGAFDGVTISIPLGETLVPVPEGNRYLGFIFASGDTPEGVEAALRAAHDELEFSIAPGL